MSFVQFFDDSVDLVLQVKTVKVSNVSLSATMQDIKEFFSFSGDIEYVEMQRFVSAMLLVPSVNTCWQCLSYGFPGSLMCYVYHFCFTVRMSGLKLPMSRSKIHREQKRHFFFRWFNFLSPFIMIFPVLSFMSIENCNKNSRGRLKFLVVL